MRKRIVIWLLAAGIAGLSPERAYASASHNKSDILKSFVSKKILYNESTPVDSVISWTEEILPRLKQSGKDKEMYFLLQLQLVNAYALRGDISLGIDRARMMYEEAKQTDYNFGMVTANQAIGDAYTFAGQHEKALESYQDALKELDAISTQHPYRPQILLKTSNTLQREGRLQEAKRILDEIKITLREKPDYATSFFVTIEEANYAISHGHLSQTYLQEAAGYLQSMDSICRLHPDKFYSFHLKYTTAAYLRAKGNWDRRYWDEALAIYEELRKEYSGNKRSTYYRWVALETIYLYKIQGEAMKASRLYQELYPTVDLLASEGYTRQINILRAKYKVDKMAIANKEEQNRVVTSILVGSIVLIILFSAIAMLLRRQRKKIALSTRNLERLRTHAENATSAKSVFLSNMSHEIRTPLNALSGFSSLLTEEGLDDETRRQCNEVILQNSELLLKLINDVIDLSSLEFGKLQFCFAVHDVVSICRNVADTVGKVKQTQATIAFETELESMMIETDDSRLQQVLINLLINATKFTPEGSIVLELKKESEEYLLFSVTDTGCGIPKEKQGAIFQRFEKLNENAQGSGLGLSICQLIIEHIGGKIWIDPDYEGGSRFLFTHPISQTHVPTNKKEKKA